MSQKPTGPLEGIPTELFETILENLTFTVFEKEYPDCASIVAIASTNRHIRKEVIAWVQRTTAMYERRADDCSAIIRADRQFQSSLEEKDRFKGKAHRQRKGIIDIEIERAQLRMDISRWKFLFNAFHVS